MPTKKSFGRLRDKSLFKSIAFTRQEERKRLGLQGLLPHAVASQKQLVERVMESLRRLPRDIDRYMALSSLLERNERDPKGSRYDFVTANGEMVRAVRFAHVPYSLYVLGGLFERLRSLLRG